jgi:type VI secretion system protein ImpD
MAQIQQLAQQAVLSIDELIARQVDAVLHHPEFQRLEASWRGLEYLTDAEADYDENLSVKIKVLNVSWLELGKDLTRAIEFDQSNFFKRVYSEEFDQPGGEPFGVLIGDYYVSHKNRKNTPFNDVEVLAHIASTATAALCPFITGASPALFGLDNARELGYPIDATAVFEQTEYASWKSLRSNQNSRFIGLTLPNILMRQAYEDDHSRAEPITYRETVTNPEQHLCWGNSAFAFGSILIRAFANTGWFADIRGGEHNFGEGGVVKALHYGRHRFQAKHNLQQPATNCQVDDYLERELNDLGFIPLCSYHSKQSSVFFSNSSLHEPAEHSTEIARANAKLSAMIQYMLCVSRFGHYIKVMGRDKVGSFTSPEECQRIFQNWLNQYTTSSETGSTELKARYPLSASKVEISEKTGSPGFFNCVMHLQPHFQLDQLVSSIKLVTELALGTGANGSNNI